MTMEMMEMGTGMAEMVMVEHLLVEAPLVVEEKYPKFFIQDHKKLLIKQVGYINILFEFKSMLCLYLRLTLSISYVFQIQNGILKCFFQESIFLK